MRKIKGHFWYRPSRPVNSGCRPRIGSFFGHISKMKYAHFLKKMGILQMGIFKNFQKNGHIVNGHMPKYAH